MTEIPYQPPRPVFIVGSPRSGTSVLTWCLGQHPNILPLEESNWIGKLAVDLGAAYAVGSQRGPRSHLGSMGVTAAEFYEAFGVTINALTLGHSSRYEELCTQAAVREPERVNEAFTIARECVTRKTRWVDGTPEYSFSIVGLLKLFPHAKFIHLVRDVRPVVRSLMRFATVSGFDIVGSEQEAYDYWLRTVAMCVRAERAFGSGTVLRVRHADLVSSPEVTLRRCFDHLGEEFVPDSLAPLGAVINSSRVAAEDGLPTADRVTVEAADRLNRELLDEDTPTYPRDEERVRELAQEFAERVKFYQDLETDRDRALAALSRLERELWAAREAVALAAGPPVPEPCNRQL